MALWKNGEFIANEWRFVPDQRPLPPGVKALVTLQRWLGERDDLVARQTPVGLTLAPDADWSRVCDDLDRFAVIAVSFPKFADGRSFSVARLLRERDGYAGEIRAVGDYFIDQVPLMRRAGIDAFETDDPALKRALDSGLWPDVVQYLQPMLDRPGEVPAGSRPWARRAADP
ncbi:MAG: DUF934 domain-containing protein [Alphaproteobacteria bacterium]